MAQDSDVLLDNWTIDDAVAFLYRPETRPKEGDVLRSLICLSNLVEAIVLFDRIRFVPGYFQEYWSSLIPHELEEEFDKVLLPLDPQKAKLSIEKADVLKDLISSDAYKACCQRYQSSELHNTIAGTSFVKKEIRKGGPPFDLNGAVSYDLLSRRLEIPYVPHCLRTPVFMFLGQPEKTISFNMVNYALESLETRGREHRKTLNDFTGYYSFFVPIVLSSILKQVNSPADIFSVALQMRNNPHAVEFRSAILEATSELKQGKQKKAKALKKDIDIISNKLGNNLESVNSSSITISILGLGVTIPANLSSVKRWFSVKRKPHLRFLQSLYDAAIGIASVSESVKRVFDINISNFDKSLWSQYKMTKESAYSKNKDT